MKQRQILTNWEVPEIKSIKQATSGLLNTTYIIRCHDDQVFVLQKLHPAISIPGCTENYFHVTQFLNSIHSKTQTVIPTKQGELVHTEKDFSGLSNWRLLRGLEGEVYSHTTNAALAYEGGKLLSEFHAQIRSYKKPLAKTLPMFRYNEVIEKLNLHQTAFLSSGDKQIKEAANFIIAELPKLKLPTSLPKQVIHTDPKISNFLFTKSGKGICMIDLDTVQTLNPLYDIGDALRSWCGQEEDDPNNKANFKIYSNFIHGYLSNRKHPLSRKEKDLIPQACKLVTLGLAARFLNDYKEDYYFGWDKTRYKSRKAHNKARTLGQLSLYNSLVQEKFKKF